MGNETFYGDGLRKQQFLSLYVLTEKTGRGFQMWFVHFSQGLVWQLHEFMEETTIWREVLFLIDQELIKMGMLFN